MVHIYYWWNSTSTQKKLLTKYHHYIYDDNEHDTFFVQEHFKLHWAHLTFGCSHNAMSQKRCQTTVKTIIFLTYVHMVPFNCNHNNGKLCLVTNTNVEIFKLNCYLFQFSSLLWVQDLWNWTYTMLNNFPFFKGPLICRILNFLHPIFLEWVEINNYIKQNTW